MEIIKLSESEIQKIISEQLGIPPREDERLIGFGICGDGTPRAASDPSKADSSHQASVSNETDNARDFSAPRDLSALIEADNARDSIAPLELGAPRTPSLLAWITASMDGLSGMADIDAFWVEEAYRGRGLGSRLLSQLTDCLKEAGAEMVSVDLSLPEDAHMAAYFIRHGFYDSVVEYPVYHMRVKTLRTFIREKKKSIAANGEEILLRDVDKIPGDASFAVVALEDLTERELYQVMCGLGKGFLDFAQSGIDPHFSMASFRNGKAEGLILIRERLFLRTKDSSSAAGWGSKEDIIEIVWLAGESFTGKAILRLIWQAVIRLCEETAENARIDIVTVVRSTTKLVERFFGRGEWELAASQVTRYIMDFETEDASLFYDLRGG